ncbi:FtsK/SpoIIIE domain-containing protein, partial [Streptococcus dentapri]
VAKDRQITQLAQPWLPPLKERIYLEEISPTDFRKAWASKQRKDLVLTLGMGDFPNRQEQKLISINLTKEGHIFLYGSVGTGKTTFLHTSALELAQHHSPDNLNFYLLDFGTNGLAPLSQLPHVADWITLDQSEKLLKFLRVMTGILNSRQSLLAEQGVGNVSQYETLTGKKLPTIVILTDSYETIRGEEYEESMQKLFIRISREGINVGIHMIMTSMRQANIRVTLYSNFKTQLTLRQNDMTDVINVVGRTPYAQIEDIKGRGLIKLDEAVNIQLGLPIQSESEIDYINRLRDKGQEMSDYWTGKRPAEIPMLPDVLTLKAFRTNYPSVQKALASGQLPLGLDKETVTSRSWDPKKGSLLYLYEKESDALQLIELINQEAKSQGIQLTFVISESSYLEIEDDNIRVYDNQESQAEMVEALGRQVTSRLKTNHRKLTHIIIWYNYTEIIGSLKKAQHQESIAKLFESGSRVGLANIVISRPDYLTRFTDTASRIIKKTKQSLIGYRIQDQPIVNPINRPLKEQPLKDQEYYWVVNGQLSKLQLPFY